MSEIRRVIVAARLSQKVRAGDRQGYRNGIGIDTQDERSRPYAERQGWNVVATVADTVSGTVAPFARKNLKPWVTDPGKMSLYDAIVAYANDRLSRAGWRDESDIRRWAEDNGKALVIVDGPRWPPRNDGDQVWWESLASAARKEWEADAERSDRAQRKILDGGGFVGVPPRFYGLEGEAYAKRLVVTASEREARAVREAYAMTWRDNASGGDVARYLSGELGVNLHTATVIPMLRNPTYKGVAVHSMPARYGRPAQVWRIECPALVDGETWERANRALDARRGKYALKGGGRAATLLGGVARCGRCALKGVDSPMYRSGNGAIYRCSGRKGVKTKTGCGLTVPSVVAEAAIGWFMASDDREVTVLRRRDPTDYDKLVREAKDKRRALDDDDPGYDRNYAAATREVKRLERERATHAGDEPEVEEVPTGETYARRWGRQSVAERNAWLTGNHVNVFFDRGHDLDGDALLGDGWTRAVTEDGEDSGWVRTRGNPGWALMIAGNGISALIVWGGAA